MPPSSVSIASKLLGDHSDHGHTRRSRESPENLKKFGPLSILVGKLRLWVVCANALATADATINGAIPRYIM